MLNVNNTLPLPQAGFAGNDATDWTVYADTLVALDEKATEKPASNQSKTTTNQADKAKG